MYQAKRQSANSPAAGKGTAQEVARAPLRRPGAVGLEQADDSSFGTGVAEASVDSPVPLSRGSRAAGSVANRVGLRTRANRQGARRGSASGLHPLTHHEENRHLYEYESQTKGAFDNIVPVLKQISGLQHGADFESKAQRIARESFGFELPDDILADAWVDQLDMRRLFAWCVFQTYHSYHNDFFSRHPLDTVATVGAMSDADNFDEFLQSCGFHTLDITPCADGRLAHIIRYVLRLPQNEVRRKSSAGAMFNVEDNIQKWVEVEMLRNREGRPNAADAPTRYLKMVAYHYSSVDPEHEGCAAHGSDAQQAASSGLERLEGFQRALENTFSCGASIDLLLIGLDTDTDAIRVHVPDAAGKIELDVYVDALDLYEQTFKLQRNVARDTILNAVKGVSPGVAEGMASFILQLIKNNLSQIDYVRSYFNGSYPDIGHAERFIGAGIGFEEIQLRNLMYFSYLHTVEEAAVDTDVGIKIFTRLNVSRGLPVPVIVRFDYHGQVYGARDYAQQHCERVAAALQSRYADLAEKGLLHVMQVIRDCNANAPLEVLGCTIKANKQPGGHS